jgi:chromate transporter
MTHKLLNLTWAFALMSVLAVGGGTAVLPEMQRMTVHQFHWITDKQFRDIYGIGQVAPGPNMLMVMVIGYRQAGALGAAVVGLAFFLPDCILTFFANRLWSRFSGSRWRTAVQRGLAPIAIGLMLSGTYAIARLSILNLMGGAIAVVAMAILLWRRVNPTILISAAGVAYIVYSRW